MADRQELVVELLERATPLRAVALVVIPRLAPEMADQVVEVVQRELLNVSICIS